MTKIDQNVTMWSGDTKIIVAASTSGSDGAVIDITGGSITYVISSCPSGSAIVTLSTADTTCGISITTASTGAYQITLSPSHTANLSGDYHHEAQITDSSSNVSTAFVGKLNINVDAA